ncbi:hypothetical protein ONZ45_g15747 [Pleurotus djamor]|nr:hypothetical protein ONZ45_g15747 [Pleurotus djamor]
MENTNANKPVPAPEEKIQELPKEVLEEGSPTLEKDCAVCKDQFQLGTEDPAEQVVVTLPCKHPFHEPCIVPWLKSSGTCPVCRYALVPQPEHHAPGSPTSDPSGSNPRASPPRPGPNEPGLPMNIFQALFGNMNASGDGRSGSPSQRQRDTRSHNRRSTTDSDSNRHVPGEWHEDLD